MPKSKFRTYWERMNNSAGSYSDKITTLYPSDLKGYWKLNDTNATALDYSGYNNHGTIVSPFVGGDTFPDGSYTLALDGINSSITVAENAALNPTSNSWTISIWFKPYVLTNNYSHVVFKSDGGWAQGYGIRVIDNAVTAWISHYSTYAHTISLELNVWSHLLITTDGTTLSAYQNGGAAGSRPAPATITNSAENLVLGYSGGYASGAIAHLAIWDRHLSSDDALYLAEL